MMYNNETTDAAIVLLGHGSIRESANVEIRGLWKLIMEQMPEYHIQGAFVEVAEPLLDDVIGTLATEGVRKVVIVPLFLTRGHHMLNGIPEALEKLRNQYPQMELVLTAHLGSDPLIAEIVKNRIREASK